MRKRRYQLDFDLPSRPPSVAEKRVNKTEIRCIMGSIYRHQSGSMRCFWRIEFRGPETGSTTGARLAVLKICQIDDSPKDI